MGSTEEIFMVMEKFCILLLVVVTLICDKMDRIIHTLYNSINFMVLCVLQLHKM